jgi:hypothetical protein
MTSPPIVFFHRNWSWYLPYVLRQARAAGPGSEVLLVGEVPVPGFPLLPLKDFEGSERAAAFRRVYRHMSPNPEPYELFCFLRWFYLLELMEARGLAKAMHLDSDFLLYASPEALERTHPIPPGGAGYSIPAQTHESLAWHASAHVGLFTVEALRAFCDFAVASYAEPARLAQYEHKWKHHGYGGVCDMTTLYLFAREQPGRVVNLAEARGGAVMDHNVNLSDNHGEGEYQLEGGLKRVAFDGDRATVFRTDGTPVQALGLHFQGSGKLSLPRFYRGPAFPGKALSDLNAGFKRVTRRVKRAMRGR